MIKKEVKTTKKFMNINRKKNMRIKERMNLR